MTTKREEYRYPDRVHAIEKRVSDLLERLTLKEKFRLLTSNARRRFYSTDPIKRLDIKSFKMPDGPLGVAFHSSFKKNTRFPTTKAMAATWNRDLMYKVGKAIGEEVRAVEKHMLLAPGINIDRVPLNGRTFEYFSEDPYMTKEMAIPFVKGVQSVGIAACIKHFVANNQETDRRSSSSEVDKRTLHEIYLKAFEDVVKVAEPMAVMACYNKVNGVYGCEHKNLIRETLIDKWGFSGLVVSDWFATRPIESTADCINAGLCLEMPWPSKYKTKSLERAFDRGEFTQETLDDLVSRVLRVMIRTGAVGEPKDMPKGSRNTEEHQLLARRVAEEGMVLLKNEENLLPIDIKSIDSIALLGPNLKKKFGRFLYGGSSAVVPPYEVTPLKGIKRKVKDKVRLTRDASKSDIAIIFAGLDHGRGKDSETKDRESLSLPKKQIGLIEKVSSENPNTIVVLISGSPVSMKWIDRIPTVLQAWYSGMEGGNAIANVLFGEASPTGRLPITFPKKIEDCPAFMETPRTYPGDEEKRVYYDEGIYVGYRWFDQRGFEPLYPFGFGISYSSPELQDISVDKTEINNMNDSVSVELTVSNIGDMPTAEVLQVYSSDIDSSVERPPQELVGFEKVFLAPKESIEATVRIKASSLTFYDVEKQSWNLESGEFVLGIGRSSRDIVDRIDVRVK